MRHLIKYILIGFFTLILALHGLCAIRPISPSGDTLEGNQWLFVIGIDTYLEWPRLDTAVNDARAVKDVLVDRYHFDDEHLIELYDADATRANIINSLRTLAINLTEEDSLVIYYAGHGHLDSITKSGSWIPIEGGTKDASAWIANTDIKQYLSVDAIKAKHILLVSDSCFSGGFFRGQRGDLPEVTDEAIKKAYALNSRQAISSGGLEPVSDAGFNGHSIFSYFFIKALKNNNKPYLVPSDMFSDIKAGVAQNAEQFPQLGSLRDTGGQGGEYVFFLRDDSKLTKLNNDIKSKQIELDLLNKLELEAGETKKKEEELIKSKEKELNFLDQEITEMQSRLGSPSEQSNGGLDTLFAMVVQQEIQEKKLEDLKKLQEEEEAKRQDAIYDLKMEKFINQIKPDIEKYKKIISTKHGEDIENKAWAELTNKYPEYTKGLEEGDTDGLIYATSGIKTHMINALGMEFVYIWPGTFMMGTPSNEVSGYNDETQHKVTLTEGYYMQTTEVTQGQWKAVMGSNPSGFKNGGLFSNSDNYPVENVSWHDVQNFIAKLNRMDLGDYSLPTEAEWEYACRAGSITAYNFDTSTSSLGDYVWYASNSSNKTHPVAQKKPNAWGLYDMYGNVSEWCQDWMGDYPSSSVTDPEGPSSGSKHIHRGGCYFNGDFRSASRPMGAITYKNLGFRLVGNLYSTNLTNR